MQREFEKRACCILSKEDLANDATADQVKRNVRNQTDRIVKYRIRDEESALQFIRLSFEYPALQAEAWDEELDEELLRGEDEDGKIRTIVDYLKTKANVGECKSDIAL